MKSKLTIIDHPLLKHKLGYLRDKKTPSAGFRSLVKEISRSLAYEVMRDWHEIEKVQIETPISQATVERIGQWMSGLWTQDAAQANSVRPSAQGA